jgi:acetylornithine deacetylase/succinyl-diaminopimelate desuccinylase-like protein
MSSFEAIDNYLEAHLEDSISELSKLCAIPSIAAQNTGLQECADLVAEMLQTRGFKTEVIATKGAPVVYAELAGKSDQTLLFYNHYDVQPAEPLDLWDSPPFEATLRDEILYARGVSDDKGHITSRLYAIDALLAEDKELPCNVKFIIEGEEETGSVGLEDFVKTYAKKLAADACIWEFGGVNHEEIPMQYLGLRGICYVELTCTTATEDVHSGTGGSIFPNAAWRLVWALSSLKDANEHIRIPGFYDNVLPPAEYDKELFAAVADPTDEYRRRYGITEFLKGVSGSPDLQIQQVFEPTCTICGLTSGYQGPGSKTVLPAKASAKVDFRLVPDQGVEEVLEKLRAHLDAEGFSDIEIQSLGGGPAGRTDPNHPFVQLVIETAGDIYGVPMQIVPMVGGSGPNAAFIKHLNLPVVTAGVGHPDSRAHAPNENLRLDLYLKGAKHITRILKAFGAEIQR